MSIKRYTAERLTETRYTPTDSDYQEDLGIFLVSNTSKSDMLRVKDLPLDIREGDEVDVAADETSVAFRIVTRVVTRRVPL